MKARRLVSIRRRVPAAAIADYLRAWSAVRAAVEVAGAHAWAFASTADRSEMLEFLEFGGDLDPRNDSRVVAALAALDRDHDGITEEWEETG